MARLHLDGRPPRRDWAAEATEAIAAKRARQRERDDTALAKVEARIEDRRLKARRRASLPRKLPTIDDLQKSGDVIDVIDLKRRDALCPDAWTTIGNPCRQPAVERLVCTKHRVQIYFRGREMPQSIGIAWHKAAVFDEPLLECGCGRRARKMYPVRGSYVCRHCAGGGLVRYASWNKSYPKNRLRKRAPVAQVARDRDPATGRFLPTLR